MYQIAKKIVYSLLLLCLLSGCANYQYYQQSFLIAKRNYYHKNYAVALRQLLPFAANGDMEAQYAVGYIYYYGLGGVTRNIDLARGWMKFSAAQNYPPAVKALSMIDYYNFN